jgi:DNA-binding transcriptional LysR family regulator
VGVEAVNFNNLDLNLLRVFNEVMTEHNLTRAAGKLALTQPAVSNALRRLRESLGDDLLRRRGSGLVPTPRALALWPKVQAALDQLSEALTPEGFNPAESSATFVLSMADATAAELIPGLIRIIDREAPGINIRVVPLTTRDPRKLLESEHADMAVGFFPSVLAGLTAQAQVGETLAFHHQRLYESSYVCVMRQDHPLAGLPLTLDSFCNARHLLVSFSGRPFGFIDEALAGLGRQRRIFLTVNQFFTAGGVVASSDLLTVLPRHFVSVTGIAHQLVLKELPFKVPDVHVDALWHHRVHTLSAHIWLRDRLALLRPADLSLAAP